MVLVPAPILRTISRKTTTADELFGAEFLTEFEYERRNSVMEDTALPEQIRKALPSAPELEMVPCLAFEKGVGCNLLLMLERCCCVDHFRPG